MRLLRTIALVVGIVAFVLFARTLGWSGLTRVLGHAGWWFVVIAAIDLCGALCDACAIRSLARTHAPLSFGRALAAQLGGVSINRLTPGNALGEPIKMSLLVEELPRDSAVSTILMFDIAAAVVAIAAIVLGVPVTLLLVDLPSEVMHAAWIGALALIAIAIGLGLLTRRGLIGACIAALRRLHVISQPRADRWRARTAHIDEMVRELGTRPTRGGIAWLAGSRACNWAGTIVMLHAAGQHLDAAFVVAILSVGALVTYVAHIVPLGIGLAEGGNYLLYRALGAPGLAGLDFTTVYRARTCVLSALGLSVLAITSYRDRRRRATVEV